VSVSRGERIKDLVSLIEDPEEPAYIGAEEFDEMELYDMEPEEPEEGLYEEEEDGETA